MSMHGKAMKPEKALAFWPSTRRVLSRMAPDRGTIVLIIVLAVTAVGLNVTGPRLLGQATDVVVRGVFGADLGGGPAPGPAPGIDMAELARLLSVVLALYTAASLFNWIQGSLTARVVQRGMHRMRRDVQAKLGRLPFSYFDGQSRGDVLSRVTNDIDNLGQTLQQTITQLVVSVLTVLGVLGMMFAISPLLSLIALVTIPLSALVAGLVARQSQKLFMAQWATTGELNGHVEESLTGHEVVKAFGRQQESVDVFVERNERLYASSQKAQFVSGLIQPAMMFISNLNYVAVAVVGGIRVASGSLSIGDVQAFIQYSRQFTQPLAQIGGMANMLQSGVASAERVFELLDAREEPDDGRASLPRPVRGEVEFRDVSFSYTPDEPLIQDLSLRVEPGRTVAIVGPTGAGKTTLVNLLMRFYDLDSGRILLDGVDIASVPRDELRRGFGMVLQDAWLFEGTIRDNIRYGNESATEEQVVAAAKATYVDHFVRSLPEGYDTVIQDESANISAGQRQLLTIARAFLADPAVLVLDEATSSVDTRTELMIRKAMDQLSSSRTSFVIAHRLSTIRDADAIIVMDAGRIKEMGTHDELLERGRFYSHLHASQF